ncbi:MAG: GYF domain-containing protein [Hyalangium sp.]|uniref:GYF domain-containing protein n=1 Tax=Hyalangium sp. TaxID=2028555 RepID=UPI00389ABAB3
MSESELDAIVSVLRTDKNLALAPTSAAPGPWGALTEQLLLSSSRALDPRELEAARDEAARQPWHIALGEQVKGPLDIAALRSHWERGELGPDSLCWRKGFDGWQPVCRVKGLAELLAPRATIEPSAPEDLVPDPQADALDFPLKGAEALRILAEEVPPPLPLRPPPSSPPVLEPEPVMAPALGPEPDTVPDAPRAQEAAGAPGVLSSQMPTQVEVRVRGGMWFALGGGLMGGMLVACIVWFLGLSAGLGARARGASSEPTPAVRSAEAQASAPSLVPANAAMPPALVTPKPDVTAPVPQSVAALPGPVTSKPEASAFAPALGSLSSLGGTAVITTSSTRAPMPLARPTPTGGDIVETPKRAAAPTRLNLPDPSMRKQAKAEALPATEPAAKERVASRAAEEQEVDDDLKLDEDFARELAGPGKPPPQPKRTVWIPPDPKPVEPPAALTESDIFSVVVANKADITACVNEQKPASDEGHKVVVRWTILPSGRVTDVETETARFQGTSLALCLEGKIRAWTFPQHHEQGGPVRFPFVF